MTIEWDMPEYATVECESCGMEGTEEDGWDDDGLCPYCSAQ